MAWVVYREHFDRDEETIDVAIIAVIPEDPDDPDLNEHVARQIVDWWPPGELTFVRSDDDITFPYPEGKKRYLVRLDREGDPVVEQVAPNHQGIGETLQYDYSGGSGLGMVCVIWEWNETAAADNAKQQRQVLLDNDHWGQMIPENIEMTNAGRERFEELYIKTHPGTVFGMTMLALPCHCDRHPTEHWEAVPNEKRAIRQHVKDEAERTKQD